jgi:hypothetical protein
MTLVWEALAFGAGLQEGLPIHAFIVFHLKRIFFGRGFK